MRFYSLVRAHELGMAVCTFHVNYLLKQRQHIVQTLRGLSVKKYIHLYHLCMHVCMHVQKSLRVGIWPARSVTALEGRDALWLTGCGWGEGNTVKISFSLSPREG